MGMQLHLGLGFRGSATGATVGENIRVGTTNASTTGSYDSQYTDTWDADTYALGSGEVVVTAGVGVFDGLQTAGTYTCGNRSVVVSATVYACATSAEYQSRASSDMTDWTIVIREDAQLAAHASNYTSKDSVKFSGDGTFDIDTTRYHFGDVDFTTCDFLWFDNISAKSTYFYGENKHFREHDCHYGSNDQDQTGDYSATGIGSSGLRNPFWVASGAANYLRGYLSRDCTYRGVGELTGTGSLFQIKDYVDKQGFHITQYYGDASNFRADSEIMGTIGGGLYTRQFGFLTNIDNPHSDAWQMAGSGWSGYGWTFEAIAVAQGDGVGDHNNTAYFEASGETFGGRFRASMGQAQAYAGLRTGGCVDFEIEDITIIPDPDNFTTGTISGNRARINTVTSTRVDLINSIGVDLTDAGVTWDAASVDITAYTHAQLTTRMPDWDSVYARPTFAEAIGLVKPLSTDVLDGIGAWQAFTTIPSGNLSEYTLGYAAPVISVTTVSGATTSVTAALSTDQAKGWTKWVVVPDTTTLTSADFDNIVSERVTTGEAYGQLTSLTSGTLNISATGLSLSAGDKTLYVVHFNGAKASAIASKAFTVAASREIFTSVTGSGLTTYTFQYKVGGVDADLPQTKMLVKCGIPGATTTISSVDPAGATETVIRNDGASGESPMIAVECTPGASNGGVITLTCAGNAKRAWCSITDIDGLTLQLDTSDYGASVTSLTLDQNTTAGDLIVGVAHYLRDTGVLTGWSGVTEEFETHVEDSNYVTVGFNESATGGTPEAVDVTLSIAKKMRGMAFIYN